MATTSWHERESQTRARSREDNESTARAHASAPTDGQVSIFRCECGDRACTCAIRLTLGEYESVRAYATRFAIARNHENPEIDRDLRFISRTFPLWVVLGLALPFGLGLALTGTLVGGLTGLLWGGLVRVFLLHHVTFSINSLCHSFGRRPFSTGDQSRNQTGDKNDEDHGCPAQAALRPWRACRGGRLTGRRSAAGPRVRPA